MVLEKRTNGIGKGKRKWEQVKNFSDLTMDKGSACKNMFTLNDIPFIDTISEKQVKVQDTDIYKEIM